jgi:hypothetical protein
LAGREPVDDKSRGIAVAPWRMSRLLLSKSNSTSSPMVRSVL